MVKSVLLGLLVIISTMANEGNFSFSYVALALNPFKFNT